MDSICFYTLLRILQNKCFILPSPLIMYPMVFFLFVFFLEASCALASSFIDGLYCAIGWTVGILVGEPPIVTISGGNSSFTLGCKILEALLRCTGQGRTLTSAQLSVDLIPPDHLSWFSPFHPQHGAGVGTWVSMCVLIIIQTFNPSSCF